MNRRHIAFSIVLISVFAGLIVCANAADWSSNIWVSVEPGHSEHRSFDGGRYELLCINSYVFLSFGVLLAVAMIYQGVNEDSSAKISKPRWIS